jgi:hypothetical protein
VVLVCDNLVPHEHRPSIARFTRWMLRNSDGYLVMSDSVERDLDRLKPGRRAGACPPVYAQFDAAAATARSRARRSGSTRDVVLFFGYIAPYKGSTCCSRRGRACARAPAPRWWWRRVLRGSAPYRASSRRRRGRPSVRLLDRYIPDDEVEALFKAADVAVLPYRSATQSGVTHVAYALGVPVITTDVGGSPRPCGPARPAWSCRPRIPRRWPARSSLLRARHGPALRDGRRAPAGRALVGPARATRRSRSATAGAGAGLAMTRDAGRRAPRWIAIAAPALTRDRRRPHHRQRRSHDVRAVARAAPRRIDVPAGATLDGRDGRHYTKNAAARRCSRCRWSRGRSRGGAALCRRAPRAGGRASSARSSTRSSPRCCSAVLRRRACARIGAGASLAADADARLHHAAVGVREELHGRAAPGARLLLAVAGRALAGAPVAPARARLGVLLAISVKLSMLPLALLRCCRCCRGRMRWRRSRSRWCSRSRHGGYDFARFGTPFETGYGAQAGRLRLHHAAVVGLYGCCSRRARASRGSRPRCGCCRPAGRPRARCTGAVRSPARHTWARPRTGARAAPRFEPYAAAAHERCAGSRRDLAMASRSHVRHVRALGGRRLVRPALSGPVPADPVPAGRAALAAVARAPRSPQVLAIAGLLVQIGGVAIHFGAQMREAGDYPYTLPLNDPHFMSDSHFNPAYSRSSATGACCRATRRAPARRGPPRSRGRRRFDRPRRTRSRPRPRDSASGGGSARLLHALDFWWLYRRTPGPGDSAAARRRCSRRSARVLRRARNRARAERRVKTLWIVVLNWNGLADTRALLPTLAALPLPRGWQQRTLVVDNGSTDGSVDALARVP